MLQLGCLLCQDVDQLRQLALQSMLAQKEASKRRALQPSQLSSPAAAKPSTGTPLAAPLLEAATPGATAAPNETSVDASAGSTQEEATLQAMEGT